jgi:hypothetical protein
MQVMDAVVSVHAMPDAGKKCRHPTDKSGSPPMRVYQIGTELTQEPDALDDHRRIGRIAHGERIHVDAALHKLIHQIPRWFARNTHTKFVMTQTFRQPQDMLLAATNTRIIDQQQDVRHSINSGEAG